MDWELIKLTFKELLKAFGIPIEDQSMPKKLKFESFDETVHLTDNDRTKLKELHPLVAHKIKKTLIQAKKEGLNVGLHMGLRSFEYQAQLYAKGRNKAGKVIDKKKVVTNAKAGRSWHNYGLAGDIVFKTKQNRWSWSTTFKWARLGKIGESYGLTWGGYWTQPVDTPHFQYHKGLPSINEAQALQKQNGLNAVWERII